MTQDKRPINQNIIAISSYFIFGIFWYFFDEDVRRRSRFAKFHVKQALNFFFWAVLAGIVLNFVMILVKFVEFIPVIGITISFIVKVIAEIIGIFFFILWLFGIIYAIQRRKKEIPVIGWFAREIFRF